MEHRNRTIRATGIVLSKEWRAFRRSNVTVHFAFGLVVVLYSGVCITNFFSNEFFLRYIWWTLFSVVLTGNFANRVFIFERIGGRLEMLFLSGVSRGQILGGKILFVFTMVAAAGIFSSLITYVGLHALGMRHTHSTAYVIRGSTLFLSAAFLSASADAALSTFLSNPRLMHFINLGIVSLLVMLFTLVHIPLWIIEIACILIGLLFCRWALHIFHSERILSPPEE